MCKIYIFKELWLAIDWRSARYSGRPVDRQASRITESSDHQLQRSTSLLFFLFWGVGCGGEGCIKYSVILRLVPLVQLTGSTAGCGFPSVGHRHDDRSGGSDDGLVGDPLVRTPGR